MKQLKNLLIVSCGVVAFFCMVSLAAAIPVTATITADNHYALYFGDEGGVDFVGHNELGAAGNPGTYNWSDAETWNFAVDSGDYIYIAVWGDDQVAQGLIGQFDFGSASLLTTNMSDWEVLLTSTVLGDGSSPPSDSDIETETAEGTWSLISNSVTYGDGPWGSVAGISSDALWIWGSDLLSINADSGYQIFRTQVPAPVPEPATMVLLGTGLICLAGANRRKIKKRNAMV